MKTEATILSLKVAWAGHPPLVLHGIYALDYKTAKKKVPTFFFFPLTKGCFSEA